VLRGPFPDRGDGFQQAAAEWGELVLHAPGPPGVFGAVDQAVARQQPERLARRTGSTLDELPAVLGLSTSRLAYG